MIVSPDPRALAHASAASPTVSLLDWPSHILHHHSQRYSWEGPGILAIKMFPVGHARYSAGGGRFLVDRDVYLVLNHAQPYSIEIDAHAESRCVFFEKRLAEDVCRGLAARTEQLLDDPAPARLAAPNFYERTYPHDDVVSPALFRLFALLPQKKADFGWLEEQLHDVLARLLQVHQRVRREVEQLPAVRRATRDELYRRLHRAKDFICASLSEPLSLDEMAKVACLSPNHFLRTFKQAFRESPHQFMTARRLELAQRLLATTELPITDISLRAGFESLGYFSWLFHRRIGVSPTAYRLRKR